jgi:replicative DNA helicase
MENLEEIIVGSLILDTECIFSESFYQLKPSMFQEEKPKQIFEIILFLVSNNEPIDYITILNQLNKKSDKSISVHFLTNLTTSIGSTANFEKHCKILLQRFLWSELDNIALNVLKASKTKDIDVFEAISELGNQVENLLSSDFLQNDVNTKALSQKVYEDLKNRKQNSISGLTTGISKVDEITGGFEFGGISIIGGRPGVGKQPTFYL